MKSNHKFKISNQIFSVIYKKKKKISINYSPLEMRNKKF